MSEPEPLVCPGCGQPTGWVWDDTPGDEEWVLDGEWWFDPATGDRTGFTCSHRCWQARARQVR